MLPRVSSWPLLYLAGCHKSRNNLSALHKISVHRNVPVFCRHWQNLKSYRYKSLHFILTERVLSFFGGLFNPLNAELNPICYLLALLTQNFLHVSRIRAKSLTLRLLMSYIYGGHILDVSRSHTTTHHSR